MRETVAWVVVCAVLLGGLVACGAGGTPSASAPSYGPHNDVDVRFATQMIPHHEQAVAMSDTVLRAGDIDTPVADLATRIRAAQAPEIVQLRGWLAVWGAASASTAPMSHDGMMSDAELRSLERATGPTAQKLYLTGMITHHRGAVAMAQTELTDGRSLEAKALARSIVSSQQTEIIEMQGLLPH